MKIKTTRQILEKEIDEYSGLSTPEAFDFYNKKWVSLNDLRDLIQSKYRDDKFDGDDFWEFFEKELDFELK